MLGSTALAMPGAAALADPTPQTVPTIPAQIQPTVNEVGMGDWTPGGSTTQPGDPSQGGGNQGGGGTAPTGSSDALTTMNNTPWGAKAAAAAQSIGVNPNSLAATCVIESGCNSAAQNGGATGAFQMYPAAFQDGLNTALRANPALSSQIVPGAAGINDPLTQSIAAAGYLMQANQALSNAGVQSPDGVDARGYYEFGPSYGKQVALAGDTTPMSTLVPANYMSPPPHGCLRHSVSGRSPPQG